MCDDACAMLLVSACLAGFACRYDGRDQANAAVVQLVKSGRAIPVCPEQLGGLCTPRAPAEIQGPDGRVFTKDGNDVTAAFEKGAAETLAVCKRYGISKALLKAHSPSCGKGCVYDGEFCGKLVAGNGKTTALLLEYGIMVESVE